MKKTNLFIVKGNPVGRFGDNVFMLISEHGEGLYSHVCSSANFAEGDLITGRKNREESCKKKFGEYKVLFLEDQDEIDNSELSRRNKDWHKNKSKIDAK